MAQLPNTHALTATYTYIKENCCSPKREQLPPPTSLKYILSIFQYLPPPLMIHNMITLDRTYRLPRRLRVADSTPITTITLPGPLLEEAEAEKQDAVEPAAKRVKLQSTHPQFISTYHYYTSLYTYLLGATWTPGQYEMMGIGSGEDDNDYDVVTRTALTRTRTRTRIGPMLQVFKCLP